MTTEGLSITSFRLASAQRRFDRATQKWVDMDTNWYTITTFRQLALNVSASVSRGQRVVVTGRLRLREWKKDDRTGITVEVDAESLGHDLAWGTSAFTRSVPLSASEPQPEFGPDAVADADSAPDPEPLGAEVRSEGEAPALAEFATSGAVPF